MHDGDEDDYDASFDGDEDDDYRGSISGDDDEADDDYNNNDFIICDPAHPSNRAYIAAEKGNSVVKKAKENPQQNPYSPDERKIYDLLCDRKSDPEKVHGILSVLPCIKSKQDLKDLTIIMLAEARINSQKSAGIDFVKRYQAYTQKIKKVNPNSRLMVSCWVSVNRGIGAGCFCHPLGVW